MNNKFNVGDYVRHSSYGVGFVKALPHANNDCYAVELDKPYWGHDCEGLTKSDHGAWCGEDKLTLIKAVKANPVMVPVVGAHVRHDSHPEYGNGRIVFIHPNGSSLAVEFENPTGLDHDCAGHGKMDFCRWTKAASLELINPFKVGDYVQIAESPSQEDYYASAFNGKVGMVIAITSDRAVDVRVPHIGFPQYVPVADLTLVKVDPVEAAKAATPKVRTINFQKGSQCDRIVKFLLAGNSLTPIKARALFGAERLAARILEIKKAGHKVTSVIKTDLNGKVYAEYSLRNVGRVWA